MKLYIINDNYIDFLKNFSENVKYNKNESRPYVGIVLKINEHNYFAPLGSPKPKHIKMKEALDFIKIENGKAGVINLNNMIPVSEDNVTNIKTSTISDKKYAILLEDQLRWIERNKEIITSKSLKLYKLISEKENTIFHKRSNNFKLLEEKAKEYEKVLDKSNQVPFNAITGKQIPLIDGIKFPEANTAAWINQSFINKFSENIKIKENEKPCYVNIYGMTKDKKPCICKVKYYNIEQLEINEKSITIHKEQKKEIKIDKTKDKNKDKGYER